MGCAAGVPELREDGAAFGVDRIRDALPPGDLLVGVKPRRVVVASRRERNRGRLGDDQSTIRGALRVIFELQVTGNASPRLGAQAAQWR